MVRWLGVRVLLMVVLMALPLFGVSQFDMLSAVGTNAKMIGVGNVEGMTEAASVFFENPASLYYIKESSLSLFNTTFLGEIAYVNLAYGLRTQYGVFAFGLMQTWVGGLPITEMDEFSQFYQTGTFEYNHQILSAAHQIKLTPRISFGYSLRHYMHSIYNVSGRGYSGDMGLYFDNDIWRVSLAARNLLPYSHIRYSTGALEHIPLQIVVSHKIDLDRYKPLYVNDMELFSQVKVIPANVSGAESVFYSFGVRYVPEELNDIFYMSCGLKQYPVLDQNRSNIVVGLGFDYENTEFHFAFEPSDYYETQNKYYFSVSLDITRQLIQDLLPKSEGYTREQLLKRREVKKKTVKKRVEVKKVEEKKVEREEGSPKRRWWQR